MKVSDLLESRRGNWNRLDELTSRLESFSRRNMQAVDMAKFAALYRAACADLALADAYHLPPAMVQYLHRLVGRAHNQLYRSRRFKFYVWGRLLLQDVPKAVFHDRCVQLMFVIFWGIFVGMAVPSYLYPEFGRAVATTEFLHYVDDMHDHDGDGSPLVSPAMASFYIQHNTSIGLKCFAGGLLIIPGLWVTVENAALLGATFGWMAGPEAQATDNFFNFVTAHGPFELTAIALAAGAGLRLGVSILITTHRLVKKKISRERPTFDEEGKLFPQPQQEEKVVALTRLDSLRKTGREALPLMGAAGIMFFLAAIIEGFLSPSSAPYEIKAAVAIVSSALLLFYFVVLGFRRRQTDGT